MAKPRVEYTEAQRTAQRRMIELLRQAGDLAHEAGLVAFDYKVRTITGFRLVEQWRPKQPLNRNSSDA